MRWVDVIIDSMGMSLSKLWQTVKDREAWRSWDRKESDMTEQLKNNLGRGSNSESQRPRPCRTHLQWERQTGSRWLLETSGTGGQDSGRYPQRRGAQGGPVPAGQSMAQQGEEGARRTRGRTLHRGNHRCRGPEAGGRPAQELGGSPGDSGLAPRREDPWSGRGA